MTKKRPPAADDIQLPDPREVNRHIRLEAKHQQEKERKAKRGIGLFKAPLAEAVKRHGNDCHAQIEYLFQEGTVPAGIGRHRFVSVRRLKAFRNVLHRVVRVLRKRRAAIRNLDELSRRHVLACVKAWQEDGLGEGTIQGYLSILRRFFCLLGQEKVVPTNNGLRDWLRSNGLTAGTIGRQQIPELAKGWRDMGFSPEAFIETVRESGEVIVAQILEMELTWGFRDEEGWFCEPAKVELDGNGNGLMLRRGTKGDKPRLVRWFKDPERAKAQREALERAKALASLHPAKQLSIPGFTAEQMRNRFNWVVRRHGATKNGMGVTPHGLRHQFACDLFRDLTGMPAPVLGLLPAEEYRKKAALVREAMKEISLQMGHERPSISGAYVGSVGKLDKGQNRRTDEALKKVLVAASTFREYPISEAWLVGTYGRGAVPRPDEPMEIAVRLIDSPVAPMSLSRIGEIVSVLQEAVGQAAGMPVRVQPWVAPAMPDPAAEILFDQGPRAETEPVAVPGSINLDLDGVRPGEGGEIQYAPPPPTQQGKSA